jgi:hypothetical protein
MSSIEELEGKCLEMKRMLDSVLLEIHQMKNDTTENSEPKFKVGDHATYTGGDEPQQITIKALTNNYAEAPCGTMFPLEWLEPITESPEDSEGSECEHDQYEEARDILAMGHGAGFIEQDPQSSASEDKNYPTKNALNDNLCGKPQAEPKSLYEAKE